MSQEDRPNESQSKIEINDIPVIESQFNKKPDGPPEQMVKTKQEVIMNKNKKRIIPSKLVPESVANMQQQSHFMNANNTVVSHSSLIKFKLPVLKNEPKKQYNLDYRTKLRYSLEGPLRVLTIFKNEVFKRRVFPADITDVRVMKN